MKLLPWYPKLRQLLAPTDKAATIGLVLIIAVTAGILWKGDSVTKAIWFVYLISP